MPDSLRYASFALHPSWLRHRGLRPRSSVKRVIGSLPKQVAGDLFQEFKEEIERYADWTRRERAFRQDLQSDPAQIQSFAGVLKDWEKSKSDDLITRIAARVFETLRQHGIVSEVTQDDIKSYIVEHIDQGQQ